ncbi:hypothetical protein OG204_23665 [Streptomyces sp. NBC_01387]|uniref:hypothetical protein n=1 Tax=unclassified Streptomyces TaxID=2593676 RepID=UPI002023FB91|nr:MULTISPECIES: hypothetical protein [unclassified Streptomyces]MCX4548673.1 hypothetical protein [Streptomyces sp. NBC_01500]WSC20279.1 hypothetical protein OIE60_11605 [Streptomyces sp. NBC_01766]WSV54299.1 hypothetical protein OG282_11585 [Streptomyces sp. NBC_01014]
MASHAAPKPRRTSLLRIGLTISVAGAALGAGGAAAQAATPISTGAGGPSAVLGDLGPSPVKVLTGAVANAVAPVAGLQLDPLAKTGVDPLDNAVGTQVADFKPLSTAALTAPLTGGGALKDLLPGAARS